MISFYGESETEEEEDSEEESTQVKRKVPFCWHEQDKVEEARENHETCRDCKKRKTKRKISKSSNNTTNNENKLVEENNDLKKQIENLKALMERKDNQIFKLKAELKEAQMKIENQKTVEQQPALPVGWSDEIDLTEFFFEK